MKSSSLARFEHQFSAKIEPGTRRFYRQQRPLNYEFDGNFTIDDVPALTIHISEEAFEHLVRYIPENAGQERLMRENIPALQKAWDNYQLLLKMCSGEYR